MAGFSNLNANIGDDTGAEDGSVESINSDASFDSVKAVDDLLKEDPGKPWSKKTPETAGCCSCGGVGDHLGLEGLADAPREVDAHMQELLEAGEEYFL